MTDDSAEPQTTTSPPTHQAPDAASSDAANEKAHAVQIVSVGTEDDQYAFTFHEDTLNGVLSKVPPGWKVSVISVVGAFRTGKSFLLSWFLRYLKLHGSTTPGSKAGGDANGDGVVDSAEEEAWYSQFNSLGQHDGFDWRGGAERNTTGIWIWNEPHYLRRANPETGEEEDVAVILVDTQGMFDNETTMALTASIFGLSTLLSSYQIYNVDKRIQEDNLQQLALFSEYGRMALQSDEKTKRKDDAEAKMKPFQRIEFLVRDWQNFDEEEDLDVMETEMNEYLETVIAERDALDLKETRDQISSCFEKVSCFMFPHPGMKVTKKTYTGDVSAIDPLFLRLLDRYCERVFNRGTNLVPKAIRGRELTAAELGGYIKEYARMFESGARFPEAATMLEATANANNSNATNLTVHEYKDKMDRIAGPSVTSFLKPEELEEMHQRAVQECLGHFEDMATFGPERGIETARENTLRNIRDDFELYKKLNESRNPLAGLEIYIIPGALAMISIVLRWIADSTCSSWSSTCRAGSEFFSHIYAMVFFFMLIVAATKAKQMKEVFKRVMTAIQVLIGDGGAGKDKKD
mmetsp:Transcript_5241/g.14868  ORF Transcript_5241/g.14868 Transcript_5241/m.14868 type:complete len:577 (-) Transcript_5241:128-1858(-)|eukprot:CAMPEP_0181034430 /NCGR_PEP_ID=MMETSP1070-20121207/7809_1 /TAXON_ID=265543 /ORGANISM="Minutocellus polymorphus, Strain NH13" /LENGTH=576 /DNA_ID=CAMNT_0023111969 /DNA_START=187 /DNA_END=1917 /DNA_ORIENTATION=-